MLKCCSSLLTFFLVFNGMKAEKLKNLIILDSANKPSDLRPVQESVFNAIEKGNYEWLTIGIEIDGKINIEEY